MTKRALHRLVSSSIFVGLLMFWGSGCSALDLKDEAVLESKRVLFQQLQSNLSKPVSARVQKMPAELLKAVQGDDRASGISNVDRYVARAPSADELSLIKSYLVLLPRIHRSIFAKKLLAVFLVDGFSGAGMSDWVIDRNRHIYYYIILNSALFSESIDDWLSYKDNSTFDRSDALELRVRTRTRYKALMYAMLHEGAHVVDYELGVTPYIDPQHRKVSGRTRETSDFTDGVWAKQSLPVALYDFKHRGELNTYGMFSQRGLIPRAELPVMFSQLKNSPFVSFYSGTSWNEDLADYVTYYHIESKLGGAVSEELLRGENVIDRYEPTKTPLFIQREKSVRMFRD